MTKRYMEVAQTIMSQLGGGRFIAMTGAKDFTGIPDQEGGLMFGLPVRSTKNKINKVKITLNAMDTYDVEFLNIGNFKKNFAVTTVYKVEGIYCDMLREVFEEQTGLFTSL